eukprot:2733993-Amphidinium_carterae.1
MPFAQDLDSFRRHAHSSMGALNQTYEFFAGRSNLASRAELEKTLQDEEEEKAEESAKSTKSEATASQVPDAYDVPSARNSLLATASDAVAAEEETLNAAFQSSEAVVRSFSCKMAPIVICLP